MDSTIIIEKSVIILSFLRLQCLWLCILRLQRKVAAWLQDRIGPNRAGKGGLLQPLADGLKLFSKKNLNKYSKQIFIFCPAIAMSTALMTSAVIPWGDKFHLLEGILYCKFQILIMLYYTFLLFFQ
jgi:NADH-quinone oxidoreductase subunit H